jgi:hypothetical protein
MHRFRAALLALALFVAVGATPALAAKPLVQLSGASPTLSFDPPTCFLGHATCAYVFTNEGTGTALGNRTVTWRYEERGTVLPGLGQRIDAAAYTVTLVKGKKEKPAGSVVLHVIPSSNVVTYDDPNVAPCGTGTFSQRTVEGATIRGTFGCPGGLPSGSMEFTVELGTQLERALKDA